MLCTYLVLGSQFNKSKKFREKKQQITNARFFYFFLSASSANYSLFHLAAISPTWGSWYSKATCSSKQNAFLHRSDFYVGLIINKTKGMLVCVCIGQEPSSELTILVLGWCINGVFFFCFFSVVVVNDALHIHIQSNKNIWM